MTSIDGATSAGARPDVHGSHARLRAALRAFRAPGLLVLLHLLLALLVFDPTPYTGGDNAAYLSLARSLLQKGAYLELYDPASPPHTQYPPVLPVMIALATLVGLGGLIPLKLLVAACSGAALALSYLWLRRRYPRRFALGVTAILAVSPGLLYWTHWVLSDIPFWAFTALALLCFERLGPDDRRRFGVAVAATILAYFTRSAALPLIVAAAAWLALRRRWRDVGILAAAFLPLALLWWLRARGQGGVDYVAQFWAVDPYDPSQGRIGAGDLVARVIENDRRYLRDHLPMLLAGSTHPLLFPLSALTVVLAVVTWVRRLRRPGFAELFLPLYAGLLLAWPAVWSGDRFVLPIYAIVLAYAGETVVRAGRAAFSRGAARRVGWAAVAVLAGVSVPANLLAARFALSCNQRWLAGQRYSCLAQEWRDFYELAEWAGANLRPDAVVLSRKARLFYVLSGGLRGRTYPFSDDAEVFFDAAEAAGAEYVVLDYLDSLNEAYLGPVLLRRSAGFCIVHSQGLGRAALFKLRPGAREVPDAPPPTASGSTIVEFERCPQEAASGPGPSP